VEAAVAAAAPELVLGSQMERHIAKRLGVPCAMISAPMHVQDFPARYAPQMGFEGANVIFDTWVHPLMMGLEEHLLGMFREDSEFNEAPSHLGAAQARAERPEVETVREAATVGATYADTMVLEAPAVMAGEPTWAADAEKELGKIPFFVRGKARRNTERFARDNGRTLITVETIYDAKAFFSR
jgi:light-independent protochlorophyllide reductase subunit B